ncbi:MAG: hypothetical protein ACJATU_000362 [Rickettsiales bacterium]|jgi:hypothetical protein
MKKEEIPQFRPINDFAMARDIFRKCENFI